MEFYIAVFLEHFKGATIFPFFGEVALTAMKEFGGYNLWLSGLLATIGATLGSLINWLIGRWLVRFKDRSEHMRDNYAQYIGFVGRYGIYFLLLSPFPFGSLLSLIAGFFRASIIPTALLLLLGYAVHYTLLLM